MKKIVDKFSKLFSTQSIVLGAIIILIALTIGNIIDVKGFWVNIFSSIVGIFIGFVIGLLTLDKYIERNREEQWAKVRILTYKSIANHICDVIFEMGIFFWDLDLPEKDYLMNPISEGRDHPNPETIIAMTKMALELRNLPGALSSDNTFSDITVDFYEEVQWDLDQIRDVLTPRVIQSSNDQNTINALMEFDQVRLNLHNAVFVHKKIVIGGIFHVTLELLDQARNVYSCLCDTWY